MVRRENSQDEEEPLMDDFLRVHQPFWIALEHADAWTRAGFLAFFSRGLNVYCNASLPSETDVFQTNTIKIPSLLKSSIRSPKSNLLAVYAG